MANALFVCLHNAGRSQMSQALFERAVEGRHGARSAGTTPGDRVHPEVIEVMNELGIDLSERVPKLLTTEDANWADAVVTMGCGDMSPYIPGRRYIDCYLPDPKGQPIEAVRATREEIRGSRCGTGFRTRPFLGPHGRNGVVGPALQERLGGGGVERTCEQEALAAVAVLVPQQRELLLLLDALGEGLDRERLAELHEGVDQRLALLVALSTRDERAVDLQRVDREALQVGERGVAGAEVVDRDAHAELLDRGQPRGGLLGVAHQRGLGDLDRQRVGVEAALAERVFDVGDELVACRAGGRRR